jgi:TIR domain-containing protein
VVLPGDSNRMQSTRRWGTPCRAPSTSSSATAPELSDGGTSRLSEARGDLSERAPITAPDRGSTYDAFVSYSHAADGKLAPALRNGLLRFGTPWGPLRWTNPVRSLRVFQDQASLSANPALWATIERALAASDWFILLATPQSAQSPWVEKEVDFWRLHKSPEGLLIVQTDGDIAWDHDKNDFDWAKTTALPRRLSTVFADEPRWIDARLALAPRPACATRVSAISSPSWRPPCAACPRTS